MSYNLTAGMKARNLFNKFKGFWRRYAKSKPAVGGLFIIFLFSVVAASAPVIAPFNPFRMNFKLLFSPPNSEHPMGTDQFGRDIFSRIIWGTRVSLLVGLVSVGISTLIGVILGSISGYFGGRIDEIIMRFVEIFMMIPTFFLILTVITLFGSSIWNVMAIMGLTGWSGTARVMRAQFLSLKEKEFTEAARAVGTSSSRIIFSEILPNAIFPAIVSASMRISSAIMTEASLSFLGLGDPNQCSWGWMLNDALQSIRRAWWPSIFPGLAITITVIAFNLMGDGLNDALNPQLKER